MGQISLEVNMSPLSIEHKIILYECVMETAKILEFDSFNKVFYCGTRTKYDIPNALLIVADIDSSNRFYSEMSCSGGACGGAYLDKPRPNGPWVSSNRHNTFHYKVITSCVYDGLNNDWTKLADCSWSQINNPYMPGLDITDTIQRYYNLKAFL